MTAKQYLKRIKNKGKRLFGYAYLGYLEGKRSRPNYHDYGIGAMAEQAVRTQLRELRKPIRR